VVVLATGKTATTGMLSVLANATVTGADVAAVLAPVNMLARTSSPRSALNGARARFIARQL